MLRFIWHHAASCLSRFMVLCTPSRLTGCPCRLVSPQHHARNKGNYKGRRTTRLPVCIPSWAWATLAVACRGAFGRHTLLHGVQICEKSKSNQAHFKSRQALEGIPKIQRSRVFLSGTLHGLEQPAGEVSVLAVHEKELRRTMSF